MADEVLHWLMSLGFPAVVAGFVLVRLDRTLLETRDAVRELLQHLKDETKRIRGDR